MNPVVASSIAVAAAYLLGAVPFAFLLVYAIKGIDVRTVGSGNVGATNAARVLGVWYFPPIFLLDALKGFLPTFFCQYVAERLAGAPIAALPVFVALATILGHNFPVYLGFKGGKGVATSIGAMFALDPIASAGTIAAFVVFLLVTKYVSVSSVGGATVFALLHFLLTPKPFGRSQVATSLLTLALWGMLIVRHRKNFARIAAGTEPKVEFRKKRRPPSGKVRSTVVGVLTVFVFAVGVVVMVGRPRPLDCGKFVLEPVARMATGHQRAERLAFGDEGRRLAVTCPRYNRLVVYGIDGQNEPSLVKDIDIEGRAVAVWPLRDRFLVLVRPAGDARHVEAAWMESIDFDGNRIGSKLRVGFDPDDIAATEDGRWAFVLLSGRAEGESNRPAPELISIDLGTEQPRIAGRLTFQRPEDDPERLQLSSSGRNAAVTLRGSEQMAAVDLSDPARPTLISRQALARLDLPYPSLSPDDWVMMPAATDRNAILITLPGEPGPSGALRGSYLVGTLPEGSGVEVIDAARRRSLGRLPLRGRGNLGTIRPDGIAYSADRGLIAVANRSGGSVHLVAIRPKKAKTAVSTEAVASR